MNGELAQTMALAAHGSAWLARQDDAPPPALDTTNTTFRYVREITFTGPPPAAAVREGVGGWLEALRDRRVERVWLVLHEARRGIVPEHNAVAFAGGGTWALVATGAGGDDEAWQPSWQLGDQHAPDQRIWDMRLEGTRLADRATPPMPRIEDARDTLTHELTSIRAFASEQQLDFWTEQFDAALAVRDAPSPVVPFAEDVFPDGHPVAARRLAATAARAWVFGGMGSWNDLGFEATDVKSRYDELSRSLYAAVLHAMVAATNVEPARAEGRV